MNTNQKFTGYLKGVPEEIIYKLTQRQVQQGNQANPNVFDIKIDAIKHNGGFDWKDSPEGESFWEDVLFKKNYDRFFHVYPFPRLMVVWDRLINDLDGNGYSFGKLQKRIVVATTGKYLACPESIKSFDDIIKCTNVVEWKYAVPINHSVPSVPLQKIKLTRQDISDGKGIGVPPQLIEFID